MEQLRQELGNFLVEFGLAEGVPFGRSVDQRAVRKITPADKTRLREIIERQQILSNRLLLVTVLIICAVFCVGLVGAIIGRQNPKVLGAAFGGNALSFLITVAWIRKLWIEKGLLDLARLAVEMLPPEEAMNLALTIYWRLLKQRSRP